MLSPNFLSDSEGGEQLAAFLIQLEQVPWFSNLGKDGESPDVERIQRWEEWSGPEHSSVEEMSARQQQLYDDIFSTVDENSSMEQHVWKHIHSIVFRQSTEKVPYDADQDPWYGPTAAVWQAAWTAGLVGLCRFRGRPVPLELNAQWCWFLKGHWPCDYVGEFPHGKWVIF